MTGEMLPEGCNRVDFRDPKIWKENDTYYMIVGNKNENQIGQVVLCSSKNLTDWKFETILASNESGKLVQCGNVRTSFSWAVKEC